MSAPKLRVGLVEKVTCPVCDKQLSEVNSAHLRAHDLTYPQAVAKYPNHAFRTEECSAKKVNGSLRTKELGIDLARCHTLAYFQEKYGEECGTVRHNLSKKRKSESHSLEYSQRRYGKVEGLAKFKQVNRSRAVTKQKLIQKHGKKVGEAKYNHWRYTSNTVQGYVNKHGAVVGLEMWLLKNNRNSLSSSKIGVHNVAAFMAYKTEVCRHTNLTISLFKDCIENIDLRSREYHLDHKISVCYGFNNKIGAEVIGCLANLEILPASANCSKQDQNSISLEELLEEYDEICR